MIYLLDACALLAFIKEEKGEGFETVDDLITRATDGEIILYISAVNLVEVYYDLIRTDGQEIADTIMQGIEFLPIIVIETISAAIRRNAARMKVRYSMSLADTFLCAVAKSINAVIVTKDSEIMEAKEAELLAVIWIK